MYIFFLIYFCNETLNNSWHRNFVYKHLVVFLNLSQNIDVLMPFIQCWILKFIWTFAGEFVFDFESSDEEWKPKSDDCIDESDESDEVYSDTKCIRPFISMVPKTYCYFSVLIFSFFSHSFFPQSLCNFLETLGPLFWNLKWFGGGGKIR